MEGRIYQIKGMTCGGCAKHVEKALRAVPGVTAVAMDVPKGTATVESTAPFQDMASSVSAAGYEMVEPA
jgi:Cu+-exporting ATPase